LMDSARAVSDLSLPSFQLRATDAFTLRMPPLRKTSCPSVLSDKYLE